MKPFSRLLFRLLQYLLISGFALAVFLVLTSSRQATPAHAFPEYSNRTGEPCSTCHVNPGGGGPRTLRGLLWAARGRPDVVPQLADQKVDPTITDGAELYEVSCAGCHGTQAEGSYAYRLANSGMSKAAIKSFTLNGIEPLGMPKFEGQFSDSQLEALVSYLAGLANGTIQPLPDQYPLGPATLRCDSASPSSTCGGN